MELTIKASGNSRSKTLDDYSNSQEITTDLDLLTNENFILSQTVEVFERYLRKRCPALLSGVDRGGDRVPSSRSSIMTGRSMSISSALTAGIASPIEPGRSSTVSSIHGMTSRSRSVVQSSAVAAFRINPMFKLEIVERELEDGKMAMDKLTRKFASAKFLLQTEEENLRIDSELLEGSKKALENFTSLNTDQKTGRVFYDKFIRFLESELQNRDRDLRKMKLKTKSFQIEYNRMLAQQQQKLELRERLHPIDIEKLLIENEEHLKKLEEKTNKLLDLKRAVGKKGQNLVSIKSKLNDTILTLKNMKHEIKQKEAKYILTESKEIQNVNELITAEVLHQNIKRLHTTYKSPDVHSYLMVDVKVGELKAEKDVWERRCKYQKQTIGLLEHQVKQLSPPGKSHTKTRAFTHRSHSVKTTIHGMLSTDSFWKQCSQSTIPNLHCTPTTPTFL